MTDSNRNRRIPRRGLYVSAAFASLTAFGVLFLPSTERLRAAGPANTGHEELTCTQCHTPAEGTARQQVQANVRYLLGMREVGAEFIHNPVGNVDCLACHQNDEDRHPVYRFNEPRFAEVRETLAPQNCVSCHTEHTGRRVTVEATVCGNCHVGMEMKKDPIEPTHATLAVLEEWATCLGCHDFHGNHIRTTPTRYDEVIPDSAVIHYLAGGAPIYGTEVRFPAKTERVTE